MLFIKSGIARSNCFSIDQCDLVSGLAYEPLVIAVLSLLFCLEKKNISSILTNLGHRNYTMDYRTEVSVEG
jgi:hypothetical protein